MGYTLDHNFLGPACWRLGIIADEVFGCPFRQALEGSSIDEVASLMDPLRLAAHCVALDNPQLTRPKIRPFTCRPPLTEPVFFFYDPTSHWRVFFYGRTENGFLEILTAV